MRAVYLIRHGRPDIPDGEKICLGRKDLPLSFTGKQQAEALNGRFCLPENACVISSPLLRCIETAKFAGFPDPVLEEGLTEIDTGVWDGLSFEEIKIKWPAEYEARGRDLVHTPIPGGESFFECQKRTKAAFERIIQERTTGDLVIFTHKGVIQTLQSFLTGEDLENDLQTDVKYAQVMAFLLDGDKTITDPVILTDPGPVPDEGKCLELFKKYKTPDNVQAHCRAVAEKAIILCDQLEEKGIVLNRELIYAAAFLHDIARANKDHALLGASWLLNEGYPSVAAIVGDHMQLPKEEERISEKSVVFLADKYIKQTGNVSLRERYLQDKSPDQLAFSSRRLEQAEYIEKIIQEG